MPRAERKAERDAAKTLRRAERQERKAERAAARRERAAGLGARKAVWAGVKEACAAELQAVRSETDLGITAPGSAPRQELGLWHYLIPAGTALAPHTHPGWQLARVTDGELNPTLVHLGANRTDEPVTLISATLFEAGQVIATVVEVPASAE